MLEVLIFPLSLILVLAAVLYLYLTSNFNYWKKRGVPGPKPQPLFGTFPSFVTGKRNFVCDQDDIYRQYKNKARFVGVFVTRNPQIMIIDPELGKDVLINKFRYFMDNESSRWMNKEHEPISGANPFFLRGNEWKTKRSEIVSGLTMSRTKAMFPVVEQAAKQVAQYLKDNPKDALAGIETKNLALKCTGEVVANIIWNVEAKAFQKIDCTFVNMAKKMIHQSFNAFAYYFLFGIFPFLRTLYNVRFFPVLTDKFFTKLTELSIKMHKHREDKLDFLGHLLMLQEKKNLTTTDVVAHNLTFLFAGFENTAGLISHCLLLLARYPDTQERLRQELMDNSECSFEDLLKLPYLDQVINETLRIFIPMPFMSKICTEPCEFTNTDGSKLLLQKEDVVLLSVYSHHHDEEYYPEPEKFIPERFSEENGGTKKFKDLGVYLPFGDGPRMCFGMKFGSAQAKSAVAEVIKAFHVTVDETRTVSDNSLEPKGFILNLKGGIYLKFQELNKVN